MPERYGANCPELKWIHSLSAGIDPLQASSLWDLPIYVSASSGIHGLAMSEHTMGIILAWCRHLPTMLKKQREHIWAKGLTPPMQDAAGKTVGFIGAGNIGTAIAKKCQAFDMYTIGLRRHPVPTNGFDEMLSRDCLPELLSRADFVVCITPLTAETRGMIGAEEFRQMKSSALFINIARGAIVDTDAMLAALRSGEIAGAALDAFVDEPLSADDPLWDMENVLITPHTAAVSPGNTDRSVEIFCDNIRRFMAGEPLRNQQKQP
ncbi:MAG: D-2-hydroxyacid dehydrogenase [Oscillospiraceae bacterium]|nr:D-2-hydroxyacid dehydrogenase [Oscillospiraceae bacterium]